MQTVTYQLSAADGLLPNPNMQFNPNAGLSSEASINTPQLIKVRVPISTSMPETPSFYVGALPIDSSYFDFMFYDESSSAWAAGSGDNHDLGDYLSIYIPFKTHKKAYVCLKASDEATVPDMDQGGYYYKVDSIPPKSDYNLYATIDRIGGSTFIPIACHRVARETTDETQYLNFFGLWINPAYGLNKLCLSNEAVRIGRPINNFTGRQISTQTVILEPGAKPPTTDERLTKLEGEINDLRGEVRGLTSTISQINQKLDRILSATSTFFVSR